MNTKILRYDSRNKPYNVFGQTVSFPAESHFGDNMPDTVELPGEIDCTALSAVKIAYSQKKAEYDVDTLWKDVPHNANGASPQATLGTAVKEGLLNKMTGAFEKLWEGYFQADSGTLSAFDNTRSAMSLAQSSAMVNTYWYRNWIGLQSREVMPMGDVPVNEHSYVFVDWVQVNGVTMAKIDWHGGYPLLMPQEVFNAALSTQGSSALMPSTHEVGLIRKRTILEWIVDAYNNLLLLLKRQAMLPKNEPVVTVEPITPVSTHPTVTDWANAIKIAEGNAPYLNNPGSLKVAPLTVTWGAKNGVQASDGGWIAQFDTYDQGFAALCHFLTLGCHDELKAFHQARTLDAFTRVYAGNPPQGYVNTIVKILDVDPSINISTFIS